MHDLSSNETLVNVREVTAAALKGLCNGGLA